MAYNKNYKITDGQFSTISLENVFLQKNSHTNLSTVLSCEPCQAVGNISLSTKLLATVLQNHAIHLYRQNGGGKESGDENPISKSDMARNHLRNAYKQKISRQGVIFAVTARNNKDFPGWPRSSPLMTSFKYYFGTIRRIDSSKSFILLKYVL